MIVKIYKNISVNGHVAVLLRFKFYNGIRSMRFYAFDQIKTRKNKERYDYEGYRILR